MIKKLKSNILKSIKNKRINVFFLFLLMAFIILIFSKLSKEYTNTVVFNIKKVNVPIEYVILNDTSTKLEITLKTIGFNWLKFYFFNPEIKVDFKKDVVKKESYYVLNKSKIFVNKEEEFGSQIDLLNVSPDELYFRYDVNAIKKIPVIANADINFSQGFDTFKPFQIVPDSIQLIGPKELVKDINSIQTKNIVLENVKSDLSETIQLELPQNNADLIFSNEEVRLEATVEKFTEGSIKVPVNLINVPEDLKIKYFPKSINVIYYTSLKNFNGISAKDFKVVCDFNDVSDNQNFLLPKLNRITNKVKSAKINQQHIEFIITE